MTDRTDKSGDCEHRYAQSRELINGWERAFSVRHVCLLRSVTQSSRCSASRVKIRDSSHITPINIFGNLKMRYRQLEK